MTRARAAPAAIRRRIEGFERLAEGLCDVGFRADPRNPKIIRRHRPASGDPGG